MNLLGRNPEGEYKRKILASNNYKNGRFINLAPTRMMRDNVSVMDFLKDYFNLSPHRIPKKIIPSIKSNLIEPATSKPVITWFGHSSYMIQIAGKNILVDPVFSGHASPFSFMVQAFNGSNIYSADEMPQIDLLVLTHDHYDHLDFKTLLLLKNKVKKICCSLGVASHLVYWGYDKTKIIELDWWEEMKFDNLKLTAAPARHFSGRTLKRAQTLWSAFVLEVDSYQLFLGGDSGYGEHFIEIGKRFGGFDIAFLESGQYNIKWPLIHMTPEETVQANIDLRSKVLMPVHWGKFALAFHDWNEPANRVRARAKQLSVNYTIPVIGDQMIIGGAPKTTVWWNED